MLPESLKVKQPEKSFRFKPITDVFTALKQPVLSELFSLNFIYISAFAMMQITAALLWIDRYALNEKEVGFVFMFIGLVSAILQGGFVGKLNKAFGEAQLLLMGCIFMIVGLLIIPYVPQNQFWLMLVSMAFISFANACITPAIISLITFSAPKEEQGQALGMNQSFGSLSRVAGPAFGGLLYQMHYSLPYICGASLMLVCVWLSRKVSKQKPIL
jgi:MFS family permease